MISWRRKRKPTPVFVPGKSHGQRNLLATGHKESDTIERLHSLHRALSTKSELSPGHFSRASDRCIQLPAHPSSYHHRVHQSRGSSGLPAHLSSPTPAGMELLLLLRKHPGWSTQAPVCPLLPPIRALQTRAVPSAPTVPCPTATENTPRTRFECVRTSH